MARIIDPKNVISLMLSDEMDTPSQIRSFLFHFRIDQFIRLRSLTLMNVEDDDLNEFQKHIIKYSLTTFSMSPRYYGIDNIRSSLSSIISHNDLRKFQLQGNNDILSEIQWPISCRLEHVIICYECNWNKVYSILSHLSHLQKLVLKDVYWNRFDDTIVTHSDITQSSYLTSLLLNLTSEITMDNVESFLSHVPRLTHLRLIGQKPLTDPLLFDGSRWENFIQTKLSLLNKFEFWFTRYAINNQDYTTIEPLIVPFRTSFWLEFKHWFVKCDYEYNRKFHLYSIPIFQDKFYYTHPETTIQHSALNNVDNNTTIIVNTHRLSVELSRMIDENIRQKTNPKTNYLFRNVTELTLMIDRKWPIGSIEHLSTIVNLSNLQALHLNFRCECKFAVSLDIEMNTLFKRAWNLRSIQISCHDSQRIKLVTLNAISLKLPRHIKRLDTDITYVDDAKIILERAEHLSSVTFRHCDEYNFTDKIIEWLSLLERDVVCEKLFNDLLLSSDFLFHDGYSVPKVKCLHEYIDKFSLIDPLQIFGLHPNADNNIFNKST
ncbi:unnamed protein product [Rotaria sp. Silwood2]|nr:unnamed protein product [Rotaria sp. Silwood2]CAF4300040.1 unnamed protein product [Rotaria sp. Silwood2]